MALYELVSSQLHLWFRPPDDKETWSETWDEAPAVAGPAAGAEATPAEAALAAAAQLRAAADESVGHRHVVFVRHARPAQESSEGAAAAALASEGLRQAELTGKHLHALFGSAAVVYCSASAEAKATAEAVQRGFGKECRLRESALFAEGLPAIPSPRPAALGEISDEELVCDSARAEGAFRALMWRPSGAVPDKVSVEIVVSHGNIIRYLVCRALQLPPTAWSRLAAFHCAVTWLDLDSEGGVTLREFGSVGHLPPELVTYH